MKNIFGNVLTVTLFGESHGEMIGCVLDGLAPGITVSQEKIDEMLALRRPQGKIATARREPDPVRIVSGVFQSKTTGTPLCLLIPNQNQNSADYAESVKFRPGHADYAAQMKYHGFQDPRGGGHFSGRITAALVAAGAIVMQALEEKNILIGTHIKSIAQISDRKFQNEKEDLLLLKSRYFGVLDEKAGERMQEAILSARAERDSVGGVLETMVTGLPAGVGEPWFDSLESMLAHGIFSIPAVKGIEFGEGFAMASLRGSTANDALYWKHDGTVGMRTNHNGGINGGISNGMPLLFRTVIKPTPTISLEQETVDWTSKEPCSLASGGRHDPCIVPRARIVADAVTALVLADALSLRFGTDWLGPEGNR